MTTQVRASQRTGWWGTVLLLLVLASMLTTLLFAYPYLAAGSSAWGPAARPPLGYAIAAAALAVGSLVPAVALHRAAGRGSALAVQAAAVTTAVVGVALVLAAVADLRAEGASATADAYGSVRVVSAVFHLAVAGVAIVVLLGLPLRLWAADLSERQRGMALNAALLWYYVVGGWLVVSATVHVAPLWS